MIKLNRDALILTPILLSVILVVILQYFNILSRTDLNQISGVGIGIGIVALITEVIIVHLLHAEVNKGDVF